MKDSRTKRGFLLATALIILPIFVIVLFGLIRLTMEGSGLSAKLKKEDQLFYMGQTGLSVGLKIFGSNNYAAFTHDLNGSTISDAGDIEYLHIPDGFPVRGGREGGWVVLSDEGEGWSSSGLTEDIRFKIEPLPARVESKTFYGASGGLGKIQRPRWRLTVRSQLGSETHYQMEEGEIVFPGEFALFDNGSCSDFSRTTDQLIEGDIHANGDLYLMPWMVGADDTIESDDILALAEAIFGSVDRDHFYETLWGIREVLHKTIAQDLGGKVSVRKDGEETDILDYKPVAGFFFFIPIPRVPDQAQLSMPTLASNTGTEHDDLRYSREPPKLDIKSNSVTAGREILRRQDLWGRTDSTKKSQVRINDKLLPFTRGSSVGDSNYAMDSKHSGWESFSKDQLQGKVRAGQGILGQVPLPEREAFLPGGYFSRQAALTIDRDSSESSWLKRKTFYNQEEKRWVEVAEIDVQELNNSGSWPSNNQLYASVPVRLVEADHLPSPLSLSSCETVYFKGDFNEGKKPATVMTLDRVYKLTKNFEDDREAQFVKTDRSLEGTITPGSRVPDRTFLSMMMKYDMDREGLITGRVAKELTGREVSDPIEGIFELYNNIRFAKDDGDGVLSIHAVIVDGQPEMQNDFWKKVSKGERESEGSFSYDTKRQLVRVDAKNGRTDGSYAFVNDLNGKAPTFRANLYATHEGYLENLRNLRVEESGSRIHLRKGKIAPLGLVSEASQPGVMPEKSVSAYVPPRTGGGGPGYKLTHDARLMGLDISTGAMSGEIPMLRGIRRLRWSESSQER